MPDIDKSLRGELTSDFNFERVSHTRGRPGPGRVFTATGFFGTCDDWFAYQRSHEPERPLGHCIYIAEHGEHYRRKLTNPRGPRFLQDSRGPFEFARGKL